MKNYYLNILFIAIVVMATVCIPQTGCQRDQGVHQQVLNYISQAEEMLEKEDLDSSMALLHQAYSYSNDKGYKWGMAEANLDIARTHTIVSNIDSALFYLNQGMALYPEMPDSMLTQYYAELAVNHGFKGEMREAKEFSLKTIPLMLKYGSDEDKATIYGNTGIYYRHLGMNDSAIYCYQQGIEIAHKSNDYASQAFLANSMAVLFADMQRYEECYTYCQKAYDAAGKIGDKDAQLKSMMTRGATLTLELKYEEAADCLLKAYDSAKDGVNPVLKLGIITPLVKAVYHSKRPEIKAQYQHFLQLGNELYATQPPSSISAGAWLNSIMTLQIEQKRYEDALKTIARIEEIEPQMQVLPQDKLYLNKAKCLYRTGKYQEAYDLQLEAYLANDSIKNHEITDKISQLTASQQMMEKELEVSRLSQQHARNQTRISILVAVLIALLAALGALILKTKQRRQQAQMRETRKWVEGIEQERARFAHELHDGACNELLAIGMQLRSDMTDIQDVGQQIGTLRAQLRNLSHELMPPQFKNGVRLDKALAYYLSHIDNPKVNFQTQGESWDKIPAETAYQVYRITQEAIGNIIVHQPNAFVEVNITPSHLDIISHGNMQQGDGTGIGMQSMTNRADSIGATLKTSTNLETFTVSLDFPTQ